MYAVAVRGGKIRARVAAVKSLASALCIGTGGSVGREGPIVQIGSTIGSVIGQLFRMSDDITKTLVGCGAAAGISATFNAPIAGAIFAAELILGQFRAYTFSVIVLSSVAASVVARVFLGNSPAFSVPPYELAHPAELVFYSILGLLAALVGRAFIAVLYRFEDLADGMRRTPEFIKPAFGGLLIGLLGLTRPEIFGVGYEGIERAIYNDTSLGLASGLLPLKMLATSITIGSGGSGGVFAPSLFMGAMLGSAFGHLVHSAYPSLTASAGAYSLVGMGAVFAGATQAPITAIIILFELTRDYRIILPLMVACVLSSMISGRLSKETIYTLKLSRRGINLRAGRDVNVTRSLRVEDAMTTEVNTVSESMVLADVIKLMQKTRHNGFPVVDSDGRLVGIITLEDIRKTDFENRMSIPVANVCSRELVVSYPSESLEDVLQKLGDDEIGRLPVVDQNDPGKLIGLITRTDVIKSYNRALLGKNG